MSREAKLDTLTQITAGLLASGRYHYVEGQSLGDPDNPEEQDVPCLDKDALLDDVLDVYGSLVNLANQIDDQEGALYNEAILAYHEKVSKKCTCKQPKTPPKQEPPSMSTSG